MLKRDKNYLLIRSRDFMSRNLKRKSINLLRKLTWKTIKISKKDKDFWVKRQQHKERWKTNKLSSEQLDSHWKAYKTKTNYSTHTAKKNCHKSNNWPNSPLRNRNKYKRWNKTSWRRKHNWKRIKTNKRQQETSSHESWSKDRLS